METRDDAGYVPFGGGLLLQTADFFTPVVDDPYRFGQIAAANAFSDIYTMGGEPLTAMNLVCFPCSLDLGILREILAGGQSKIEESGARLCGGHSVQDEKPKYGLSVTGWVEAESVVANSGARAGDALVLTKPLGLGILTTALKRDLVSEEEIEEAVKMASRLNRGARDTLREVGASAATDVTGYGLLGHLSEMLEASGAGETSPSGKGQFLWPPRVATPAGSRATGSTWRAASSPTAWRRRISCPSMTHRRAGDCSWPCRRSGLQRSSTLSMSTARRALWSAKWSRGTGSG